MTTYNYELEGERMIRGEGRATFEVDETGNALDSSGPFVARYEDDGSIALAVEGPVPATRLEVLPVMSLAELVPEGTPVAAAETAGEATPAP